MHADCGVSYPAVGGNTDETLQIYHPNVDLEGNVCLNILREDWKPVLNLNSVMVGLQYLFLEPNADDPLNKGTFPALLTSAQDADMFCTHVEAAEELRKNREQFLRNVAASMQGRNIKGVQYDKVFV
jgi:ubiquitin-conjugating enzyme E2 M